MFRKIKSKLFKQKVDEYWMQKERFTRVHDRLDVFREFLMHKKVLHVGCTDYPIFDPLNNLHLKISEICNELHGMDVDQAGIDELKKFFDSKYFLSLKNVSEKYDTVLVPETIEHVENVGLFLKEIASIDSEYYIITAPNCWNNYLKPKFKGDSEIVEFVHPDHNYWFSPYTLKNCIQKYSPLRVKQIFLCNHDLMVVCICQK